MNQRNKTKNENPSQQEGSAGKCAFHGSRMTYVGSWDPKWKEEPMESVLWPPYYGGVHTGVSVPHNNNTN